MFSQFAKDVVAGLGATPKSLPSKYFYDALGDELFIKIMDLPEYYLTRAEMDIFTQQTNELIAALGQVPTMHFELVELGAGDGQKTLHLLEGLLAAGYDFTYVPVDISSHVLKQLEARLAEHLPELHIAPKTGDYFEQLNILYETETPRVVLYLGSNLGNLTDLKAAIFLEELSDCLKSADRLILGVDQIKSADIILPAYSDAGGVTAAFNLNLLARIKRELGGEFDLNTFQHTAEYSEETGIAASYLVSLIEQSIRIEVLDRSFDFAEGERIHTEISRKYDLKLVENIIGNTRFQITGILRDSDDYFLDIIMVRK
ncbi:L-histidine N(alpha)-methyltransferase [Hyphomonas sp.]|jgi:dimethylhistidine N-methyltransferase|uniref:L-histidine N(alpha)-methyltransferase n=1 Tax=Hyphomonas sp. TaxID=87 RepID=UPI0030F5AF56